MNKFKILPVLCGFGVLAIVFLSIGCAKVAITPAPPVTFGSNEIQKISFTVSTKGSYELREQTIDGIGLNYFSIVKSSLISCPTTIVVGSGESKTCEAEVKSIGDPTGQEATLNTKWRVAGTTTDQVNRIIIKGP